MFKVAIARSSLPGLAHEQAILQAVPAELIDVRQAADEEILAACAQADAVLTDYFVFDRQTLARMPRCRVICQYGIGVDGIDQVAATELGILVGCTPGYCVDEVADHALSLLLALARRVVLLDRAVREGHWDYNLAGPVRRLRGQVLGLIGLGSIARNLATKSQALGLEVIAYDPYVAPRLATELQVALCPLDELLERSDFISMHVPATAETRHLIDARALARMKPSAMLINTRRGALIDQPALLESLRAGRLAGAALDVLEREPPASDDPVLEAARLVLTPHAAFYSQESIAEVQRRAAQLVADVLRGKQPADLANPEAIGRRIQPH